MEEEYNRAKKILEENNQKHLLQQYDKLDSEKKEKLLNQIFNIYFNQINKLYEETKKSIKSEKEKIEPIKYIEKEKLNNMEKEYYFNIGRKEIKEGKLAVVTMAGGQGTRLRSYRTKRFIHFKYKTKVKIII